MTGRLEPVDYLTVDDLLEIAAGVIESFEVRDHGLLAAAAGRPRASVFGEDAYPRLADKVAALLHSLARNHALVDGNKRLAWAATRVFCLLDDADLELDTDEAEAIVVAVASGNLDVPDLAELIERRLRPA